MEPKATRGLMWCQHIFQNEATQALLEETVDSLLQGVLGKKEEYQQEKAVRSFCEGLGYLESLLYYQHGIHHQQLQENMPLGLQGYTEKRAEIERILESEIKRQARHFRTFL